MASAPGPAPAGGSAAAPAGGFRRHIGGYLLVAAVFVIFGFFYRAEIRPRNVLQRILEAGELTVITRNNAHCYYLYRGEPMGFEYDLAQAFADFLGVRLRVRVASRWDRMLAELTGGGADLVAAGAVITGDRPGRAAFGHGYMAAQQQIIVHRDNSDVRLPEDLNGYAVHIRSGAPSEEDLRALRESGVDVAIAAHPDISGEELIRMVAEKEIDAAVVDSHIALLNRRHYPEAMAAGPLTDKQYMGWAVSRDAYMLLDRINLFFKIVKENGLFGEIYNRYYADAEIFDYLDIRAFHERLRTRMPEFVDIIRQVAAEYDFDWRLIAAMIYQESHFDPEARSPARAYGLMQLTRRTAASYGIRDLFDPRQNIRAGVRHLRELHDFFDNAQGQDRLHIALAAYNVGQGHILDARNLARDRDLDPENWSVLSRMLPLLSRREYYKDAIYGYCRGAEPVRYVGRIMIYHDVLKRRGVEYSVPPFLDEDAPAG